jgi:hypothetical protein
VTPPVELSVVTTLYRSAPHLEAFCRRVVTQAARLTPDFEIILVNDGSPDESLAIARGLLAQEPRLRVVDLARNHGQYRAMVVEQEEADLLAERLEDAGVLAQHVEERCRPRPRHTGEDRQPGVPAIAGRRPLDRRLSPDHARQPRAGSARRISARAAAYPERSTAVSAE